MDDYRPGTKKLVEKIEELTWALEKASLAEWIELYRRPVRLVYLNFIAGIARGLGIALGVTVLGTIIIYMVRELALQNLPLIGKLIAEIVRMVQKEIYVY
ncbi:hypothetical protein SAMN00808754_1035 [Thermanaeromonas toyohensis ToBE]|uniref:Uncharacterized protein n=1 Tax=Thermanaeromonas toyohensis ToBE TaxID=698762 RepID=A0A1W1VN09_9FIRM|nr:DUF5665 domain-containing protein [Thermanaeromonas toyohensis]SMB94441.1 hypothetical protein SAMN00808754_1035 [Thermanaeromonas toyohensis ToBE]